jgi:hypothetical protein
MPHSYHGGAGSVPCRIIEVGETRVKIRVVQHGKGVFTPWVEKSTVERNGVPLSNPPRRPPRRGGRKSLKEVIGEVEPLLDTCSACGCYQPECECGCP